MERLTNSLMMHGRNNGKKMLALRIVRQAFEIIHLLTGEVSGDFHDIRVSRYCFLLSL